jgi:uncharacterized membrane protein
MSSKIGFSMDQPFTEAEKQRAMPLWLKYSVIVLIGLGVFFRLYHLDKKLYWIDETNSSLRTLGYTKSEMIHTVFTGNVVSVDQLWQFQRLSPDKGWADTWKALSGTAEHTPLYFLIARAWIGLVGHSVAAMRFVAAVFSLLVFPCLYWLCQELFHPAMGAPTSADVSPSASTSTSSTGLAKPVNPALVGWIAMALYAVTPLHVLYAQEARPYSLLSLMILLSSALLLRAIRTRSREVWLLYALSLVVGLYTQLLFSLIILTHGLYVLLIEHRRSVSSRNYLLSAAIAGISLTPWLVLLVQNWQKVEYSTRSLQKGPSFNTVLDRWALNLNLAFLDRELGWANLLLVVITVIALFLLCRSVPKRTWLFILLLVGVTFTVLAIPDLLLGGRRSLRIRYLFACFFGIQIAFAYVLATQAVWAKTWKQKAWRLFGVFLVVAGLIACSVSSQAVIWWNKSFPRSGYYPGVSSIINQATAPLVVSDGPTTDTLSFSTWLKPEVKLQLTSRAGKLRIAPGYDPVYLFNPSKQLLTTLKRRGYQLAILYEDDTVPSDIETRLVQVKRVKPQVKSPAQK